MRCTSATTGKTRESSILTRSEGVPECERRPRCIYRFAGNTVLLARG